MIAFQRPMLAASLLKPTDKHNNDTILETMKKLKYPVIATLKKDGIRAIKTINLVSRTLKLIPNKSIRVRAINLPEGFDCELWNPELQYDEVESIVMSHEHVDSEKIQFHVLDWFMDGGYEYRLRKAYDACHTTFASRSVEDTEIIYPAMFYARTPQELFEFFLKCETENGEGICFRTPDSPYKQGRSTLREQYLVKLARFIRTEVTVVGGLEQVHNSNASKRNGVGMMDRRNTLDGQVGKGVLGAFLVRDENGLEFRVGTGVGLTDVKRKEIWNNMDKWLGKTITIKHKPHGMKVKPRSPIYVGLREEGF